MPGIWQVPPACGVAPAGEHAEQPVVAVGLHLATIAHALLAAGGEAERSEQRDDGGQANEASHRASISRQAPARNKSY